MNNFVNSVKKGNEKDVVIDHHLHSTHPSLVGETLFSIIPTSPCQISLFITLSQASQTNHSSLDKGLTQLPHPNMVKPFF